MRLLILWPDPQTACQICGQMELQGWDTAMLNDGRALARVQEPFDLLLLHLCLPGLDGLSAGDALAAACPVCPPRILFVAPAEWCVHRPAWADCTIESGTSVSRICELLRILAQKPLPRLASVHKKPLAILIERFLDELAFKERMKGRAYAAWLLEAIVPSTAGEQLSLANLYASCAQTFATTPGAVERCLRVAVESVFTQGSMRGIERFFGATVDPERGKPTNRAFLLQAAQQLRVQLDHSRTAALSPNKSEMHHRPAAPTSV